MQLGTASTKDKTPSRMEASLATAIAPATEITNSPNQKRTIRNRKIDSIQSSAGSVTKQGIHKSSADHEKNQGKPLEKQ